MPLSPVCSAKWIALRSTSRLFGIFVLSTILSCVGCFQKTFFPTATFTITQVDPFDVTWERDAAAPVGAYRLPNVVLSVRSDSGVAATILSATVTYRTRLGDLIDRLTFTRPVNVALKPSTGGSSVNTDITLVLNSDEVLNFLNSTQANVCPLRVNISLSIQDINGNASAIQSNCVVQSVTTDSAITGTQTGTTTTGTTTTGGIPLLPTGSSTGTSTGGGTSAGTGTGTGTAARLTRLVINRDPHIPQSSSLNLSTIQVEAWYSDYTARNVTSSPNLKWELESTQLGTLTGTTFTAFQIPGNAWFKATYNDGANSDYTPFWVEIADANTTTGTNTGTTKALSFLRTDPSNSADILIGGSYDVSQVIVTAVYTDGSSKVIPYQSATWALRTPPPYSTFIGSTFTAPSRTQTLGDHAIFNITYTEGGITTTSSFSVWYSAP